MSTLTDLIAESLAVHDDCGVAYESDAWRFECGFTLPSPLTSAGEAILLHLAGAAAAVVADWLVDTVSCDLIDALTLDSEASAEALAALAAEARKGADQ